MSRSLFTSKIDFPLQREHAERALEVIEEFGEHDRLHLELAAAGLEAADVEQLPDQSRQQLRLRDQRAGDLALPIGQLAVHVLLQELEVAQYHVDGRLQLVRGDGHELRLQPVEFLELGGHRAENFRRGGRTRRRDSALMRERPPEVSFGNRAHAGVELAERCTDGSREPDARR